MRDPNFRQIYGKIDIMLRNARRPAYVVTFDHTTPLLRDHLARRQLRLLELSEPSLTKDPHAARRLLYLLDRLGEAVSEGTRLFLSPDAPTTAAAPLHDVRAGLEATGRDLARTIMAGGLPPDEIRTAARLLSLLADMGWNPASGQRGAPSDGSGDAESRMQDLWQRLADGLAGDDLPTRRERRQFLTSALRYADNIAEARRLQAKLQALDAAEAALRAAP